jgi:protein TonB
VGDKPGSGVGAERGPGGGGDEIFGIGNDVTAPVALRRPPPAYTAEAMRARLQGVVVLNCVVRPDGKCSDIRVTKSLDSVLGLDQQAIASAREWQFRPGMRMGQPVPVLVTLEIGFTIR